MIIGIPISVLMTEERCLYAINQAYIDYVREAGLEPLLIAPNSDLNTMVRVCDGLILPGGVDLDPTFYGENNLASHCIDPERDAFERELLYAFLTAGRPIFGICRGFQLIAREYLRTNPDEETWLIYYQHVNDHSLVEELHIPRTSSSHRVRYWPSLYGGERGKKRPAMFVNSMHHQALVMIGKKEPADSSVEVLARTRTGMPDSKVGYIVEAFRIENDKVSVLAVQWHPEELRDYKLIQTFFGVEVQDKDNSDTKVIEVLKAAV